MKKKQISIILVMMLVFVFMPISAINVSANSNITVKDGQILKPDNYHSSTRTNYLADTSLHYDSNQKVVTTYYFKMPKKCAFIFTATNYGNVNRNYASFSGEGIDVKQRKKYTEDEYKGIEYTCNVNKAGLVKVELTQEMIRAGTGYTAMNMVYIADNTKTLKAKSSWSTYINGRDGSPTSVSNLKVNVPAKGYLVMRLSDASGLGETVYAKTTGMSYETFNTSSPEKYIGVQKGTYTFKIKTNAPYYKARVKFVKVKEGAYGTSKAKARKLKKNSARKGVIVVNGKVSSKPHWYKFSLSKNANTQLTVKSLINGGGGFEGLKVSVYGKNGLVKSGKIRPDEKKSTYVLSSKDLYGKLKKGTYYIKIQNASKGNGYFTVRWN